MGSKLIRIMIQNSSFLPSIIRMIWILAALSVTTGCIKLLSSDWQFVMVFKAISYKFFAGMSYIPDTSIISIKESVTIFFIIGIA